jgi:hypothetical protein
VFDRLNGNSGKGYFYTLARVFQTKNPDGRKPGAPAVFFLLVFLAFP